VGRLDRTVKSVPVPVPDWVPKGAVNYLRHTECGQSIRALARAEGCHASTILRQVRRFETRRDDFLVDEALRSLGHRLRPLRKRDRTKELPSMTVRFEDEETPPDEATIDREARRVLELPDGRTLRTGVVDRAVAQAMALREWIDCQAQGRISRYRITQTGKAALRRLLASDPEAHYGFAEAQGGFGDGAERFGERDVTDPEEGGARRVRYNVAESPVTMLARRRGSDGQPFLDEMLVAAGERLREDFEMAQMGPRVAQNWDRFLTGGDRGVFDPDHSPARGPEAARARVHAALRDLGPGLGDVALRVCCFLEGLELTERHMGWSARSGKIVLRIALQRLKRHYDEQGGNSLLIG